MKWATWATLLILGATVTLAMFYLAKLSGVAAIMGLFVFGVLFKVFSEQEEKVKSLEEKIKTLTGEQDE